MLILQTLTLVSPWIRRAAVATVLFTAAAAVWTSADRCDATRSGSADTVEHARIVVDAPQAFALPTPTAVDGSFLHGLWSKTPSARLDDDIVRFHYFHNAENIGLYRYGKVGKNTTNSYDWSVLGATRDGHQLRGTLRLHYRKTGATHDVPFRVGHDGDHVVLTLENDPQEPLSASTRYVYVPAPLTSAIAPDLSRDRTLGLGHDVADAGVGGRMWIDLRTFATGGTEFALYQLKATGIDGRGTGWFHVGDFDDWTTEALTFRAAGRSPSDVILDMQFALSGEKAQTAAQLSDEPRALTLTTDPRSFWHVRRYLDAGPSFGSFSATAAPVGYAGFDAYDSALRLHPLDGSVLGR